MVTQLDWSRGHESF